MKLPKKFEINLLNHKEKSMENEVGTESLANRDKNYIPRVSPVGD